MFAKTSLLLAAITLAGEVASVTLSGTESVARERHARMHKRRGVALEGTSGVPCKRENNPASNAQAYNVKVVGATNNVTVVPSYYQQGNSNGGTRKPLSQSGNRDGLSSSSSATWSSAAPSASLVAASGGSGMSVVTSWSGSDVSCLFPIGQKYSILTQSKSPVRGLGLFQLCRSYTRQCRLRLAERCSSCQSYRS